jgi:hypothetical protein
MAWTNSDLVLYHGTVDFHAVDIRNNGIDLGRSARRGDFSRGFYMTRIRSQAETFAVSQFRKLALVPPLPGRPPPRRPNAAALVEFKVNRNALGRLETLAFVQPTSDWRDFVTHCGTGAAHRAGEQYDVVYGPVWGAGTGAFPDYEQVSFHTDAAIALLQFSSIHQWRPRR